MVLHEKEATTLLLDQKSEQEDRGRRRGCLERNGSWNRMFEGGISG